MASPAILDFAKLTAPIPGANAAGTDLRVDSSPSSLYFAIKGARNQARAAERQLAVADEESKDTPPPDWRPLVQNAQKALTEKSKDLEVTAFLIEALVRLNGFPGLRDGFRLARELIEKFWDSVFPLPDEEGMETRLGGLIGLNGDDAEGTLIAPILRVPITDNTSLGKLTTAQYLESVSLSKLTDPKIKQRKVDQGTHTVETFQKAVFESPAAFYQNLVQDLTESQQEFGKLTALLDQKCGDKAPPSSNIRTVLETCLDAIKSVAKAKLEAGAAPAKVEAPAAKDGVTPVAGTSAAPAEAVDVIRTRDDAFRALLKVAEFFRRTEPHTIVAYSIEQVVRWGKMPLPELLTELIPEEASRKNLFKQIGIRSEAGKGEPAKK